LRRQAGDDLDSLGAKLRDALVEAGRQAMAVNAYALAARHLRSALELTGEDHPARRRLLLDHAISSHHAGVTERQILEAAVDAQVRAADWPAAAEACLILSTWLESSAGL